MSVTALVVDDQQEIRQHYRGLLKLLGLEVLEAADGKQALDSLHKQPHINVIFLDYRMPNMNGGEFLETYTGGVPIIMISTDMQININAVESGKAAAFLPKMATIQDISAIFAELGIETRES